MSDKSLPPFSRMSWHEEPPAKPLTRREKLASLVASLSLASGLPLALRTWSPGDGWTRYRITNADGAAEYGHNMTRDAATDALVLALDLLREQAYQAKAKP